MGRLIELDAAIAETWKDTEYTDPLNVMTAIRDRLEALPTVDAVPIRHGRWIVLDECSNAGIYCSVCQKKVMRIDFSNTMGRKNFRFCPNCGADMRKDGKHETD